MNTFNYKEDFDLFTGILLHKNQGFAEKKIYHVNTDDMSIMNTVVSDFGNVEVFKLIFFSGLCYFSRKNSTLYKYRARPHLMKSLLPFYFDAKSNPRQKRQNFDMPINGIEHVLAEVENSLS